MIMCMSFFKLHQSRMKNHMGKNLVIILFLLMISCKNENSNKAENNNNQLKSELKEEKMIARILNWFRKDKEMLPSKELKEFLIAKDLDNLLRLNSTVKNLDENDNQIIREILKKWENKQAISNLLLHPNTIPQDIKTKSLIKGLNEQKTIYYNLAAIVGLQDLDKFAESEEMSTTIKNKLFQFIKETEDFRAMRATSTLQSKITKEDTSKIIECGLNKNEGVKTNLIAMIAQLHGKENIEIQLANYEVQFKKETKSLREEFERQKERIENAPEEKKGFFKLSLGMPLMGYIPNLNQIE